MKSHIFLLPPLSIALTTACAMLAVAGGPADPVGGQVLIPDTSIEYADQIGRFAHTNTKIFLPTGDIDNSHPALGGHEIRTVNPAATTSR